MNILKATKLPPIETGYRIDSGLPVIGLSMNVRNAVCAASHRHPRGQLIYACHGVMRVMSEGDAWVVPPSQAVWVPSGIEHEVSLPGEVCLRNIFIDPSVVGGLPKRCCVLKITPLLRELIQKAAAIGDGYALGGPEWRLMQVVLDELSHAEPTPLHLPMARDERARRVMEKLIRNPGDGRSMDDWARVACASVRTLERLFVKEAGMNFGAWKKQLRLLEAIDRIGNGSSITQVSYDLGYGSLSAFIEMFRKSLGTPPGQYFRTRKAVGEGSEVPASSASVSYRRNSKKALKVRG